MDENRNDNTPQISAEDHEKPIAPSIEKEIKEEIFQMKHNKAPGSNEGAAECIELGKLSNMT